jgi:hypothetical protein
MANFNGRRVPNFSQYLDDLNAIPSPYDQAVQQRQQENTFNLDEELALFTNTEFFDFDKFTDLGLPAFDAVDQKSSPVESLADQSTQNADMKFLEFLHGKSLEGDTLGYSWSRLDGWTFSFEKGTALPLGHTISIGPVRMAVVLMKPCMIAGDY